ncbi:MAG: efflux transporter periplasmic adaptor subunit, partial [Gemmatimonadetes bacterium]|nr:efflux transporter periplasmic adaptor subunit [Gemmatimonadota bacterium]
DTGRRSGGQQLPLELILADGTVHPHPGFAEFVERNIDASTGTITVEASFPNPEYILRPGQYGRVRTVIQRLRDARLIPQRAVQELQGQHQVWLLTGDTSVELRKVRMGQRVDQMWVV